MLSDNPKYTPRQREIIAQIGKKQRSQLKKHKQKVVLSFVGILVFIFAFCALVVALDRTYLFLVLFFAVIGPVIFGSLTFQRLKRYDDFKATDDYSVGLFFADSDVQVKGNAKKKQKTVRLAFFLLAGMSLLIAAALCIALCAQQPKDFSALERVQGKIQSVEAIDDFIEIRLQDDETIYKVFPRYSKAFELDEFLAVADKETPLILRCEKEPNGLKSVYYAEFKGREFLNEAEVTAIDHREKTEMTYTLGFFAAITVGLFVFPFVYRATIYKKNSAKEIYDLNFTDEELQSLSPQNPARSRTAAEAPVVSIRTGAPRWMKVFLWIIFGGGLIGILCGAIIPKTTGGKLAVSLFSLFFFLLGLLGVLDMLLNREILEGDTLTVRRFFVKKMIPVKNIRRIALNVTWWVFFDAESHVLCRIDINSLGANAIIENLSQRGVLVDNYLPPQF